VLLLRDFAESEEKEDLLLVLPYDLPLTPYSSSPAGDGGDQPFQALIFLLKIKLN
jgi:hypothetical protein